MFEINRPLISCVYAKPSLTPYARVKRVRIVTHIHPLKASIEPSPWVETHIRRGEWAGKWPSDGESRLGNRLR